MRVYARTPLDISQVIVPRGQIYLIPDRCKGCRICIQFCPRNVLCLSEERNSKGYHIPRISEGMQEGCVNCGFCTIVCPEFAIYTLPVNGDQDG